MGFFSWLGFGKPRDAPEGAKTERPGLPAITDNVRDSGQTFFFGTASSGERVDEKSAMQISTVYACVRLLAETVAGLPLHLYRYTLIIKKSYQTLFLKALNCQSLRARGTVRQETGKKWSHFVFLNLNIWMMNTIVQDQKNVLLAPLN